MNLLRVLAQVSSMTLVSRVLGLARDALIARVLGAGMYTDAFFVAFRIPNLLRRLFAEGAFSQAFLPVIAEYKNNRGDTETRQLIDHVFSLLSLTLMVLTVVAIMAAPVVIYLSAPGFVGHGSQFDLTVKMLRICFPYILFISLVAFSGAVLNTYNQFMVPAFTPVLLNVSLIIATVFLAPYFDPPITALAWGVFFGGALQLLWQVPFLMRLNVMPRWRWNWRDSGMRRILKLMGPAALGVSIAQVSLLINLVFASYLVSGSVSWLYYADRLMEFPVGMLGVALSTILMPTLSKLHAGKDTVAYSALLDWGIRLAFLLTLPAAGALAVLATPLIATLFHYGAFTQQDLIMTRTALMAYSIGLIGLILVKVFAPGFYARQNIKTPVKIAIMTLVMTQAMNLLFIGWLQHAGLALSISLGACFNAGMLFFLLRRSGVYRPGTGWPVFFSKLLLAVGVMLLVLWAGRGSSTAWVAYTFGQRIVHLAWLVGSGAASYFAMLWALGFRLRDFSRSTVL